MKNPKLDDILGRLHELQAELENEIDRVLDEKRELFRYTLHQGRVSFEQSIMTLQKSQRTGVWAYLQSARLGHALSAPILYTLILPFSVLDLAATTYQHICFRIYHIPKVQRSKYMIIDRQHLAYLNAIEKFNCIYCSYTNGVIEYIREIAARTEQYWCPIKHASRTPDPHRLVENFTGYGDAEALINRFDALQRELSAIKEKG
jgi:hypothetical protein